MIPAPLVILSAPHTEAAKLAAMLGQHPRAFALPELRLLYCDTVGELLDLFKHAGDRSADGLLRTVALLFFGAEDEPTIAAAHDFLQRRSHWLTVDLLGAILQRVAPRTAVLHDTVAALRVTDLDRGFAGLSDAAFLHWSSGPEAFSAAARAALAGRLFIPPDFYDHGVSPPQVEPLLVWQRMHEGLLRGLQARPELHQRRASLEQLYREPRLLLSSLCEWLGWGKPGRNVVDAMLQPQRWRYARRGPDAAPFGVEPEFLADPSFSAPLAALDARGAGLPATRPAATARLAAVLQT